MPNAGKAALVKYKSILKTATTSATGRRRVVQCLITSFNHEAI